MSTLRTTQLTLSTVGVAVAIWVASVVGPEATWETRLLLSASALALYLAIVWGGPRLYSALAGPTQSESEPPQKVSPANEERGYEEPAGVAIHPEEGHAPNPVGEVRKPNSSADGIGGGPAASTEGRELGAMAERNYPEVSRPTGKPPNWTYSPPETRYGKGHFDQLGSWDEAKSQADNLTKSAFRSAIFYEPRRDLPTSLWQLKRHIGPIGSIHKMGIEYRTGKPSSMERTFVYGPLTNRTSVLADVVFPSDGYRSTVMRERFSTESIEQRPTVDRLIPELAWKYYETRDPRWGVLRLVVNTLRVDYSQMLFDVENADDAEQIVAEYAAAEAFPLLEANEKWDTELQLTGRWDAAWFDA